MNIYKLFVRLGERFISTVNFRDKLQLEVDIVGSRTST